MKTLIFYDQTGTINFTQTITGDTKDYAYIIEDIPEDKVAVSVDVANKVTILDDTEEVKQRKAELQKQIDDLNNYVNEQTNILMDKQYLVINLTFKQLMGGM